MRLLNHAAYLTLLVVFGLSASQAAGDAETVYKKVHPSVVALQNAEGGGTGVLLDDSGLILTNAHVIASPLPFHCNIDVLVRGELETVRFKSVKLLGVHPTKDLALVRINPKEHPGKLQPAKLSRQKASTGRKVYAIGNPSGGGGLVLNKTITSGLLSGVDRVIDDISYYQISAPINPGNSGGPLLDDEGEVIGLVTLKLTDAENVGFAIPLHDFNPQEFVPFHRRKPNPERARDALVQADKYYKQGREAYKSRGPDHPLVDLYWSYSAHYYHTALAHDPTNADNYYHVGMLMRSLDDNEVAEAYLVTSAQLKPWCGPECNTYRELGFALRRQGKIAEAIATWNEGIAKYPRGASKVREDAAIYWISEGQDMYKAAYAAGVGLATADDFTRKDVLQNILRDAKQRLDAAGQRRLDAALAGLEAELTANEAAARRAEESGELYLTPVFAQYMEKSVTLRSEFQDNPFIASSDPQDPPAEAGPPDPQQEPPKLDLTVPRGSVDLLGPVSVKHDSVEGQWKFKNRALESPFTAKARLQIPYDPPEEYDLTLIVERVSNRKALAIGFVRGGVQSAFFVDANGGQASGLDPDARNAFNGQVLENKVPATIVMKVRDEGLLVTVDGKRLFFERSDRPFAAAPTAWSVPNKARLFIGSDNSRYHVHKFMLTPYRK